MFAPLSRMFAVEPANAKLRETDMQLPSVVKNAARGLWLVFGDRRERGYDGPAPS
jgi:hypothetical protein